MLFLLYFGVFDIGNQINPFSKRSKKKTQKNKIAGS
jgi:hypothetical protein